MSNTTATFSEAALHTAVESLDNLNFKGMLQLQQILMTKIKDAREREEAEAKAQIKAIAAAVGYSIEEIMTMGAERQPGKYRNPDNSEQEWTGRGPRPKWVKDYLEGEGKKLEDLAI